MEMILSDFLCVCDSQTTLFSTALYCLSSCLSYTLGSVLLDSLSLNSEQSSEAAEI